MDAFAYTLNYLTGNAPKVDFGRSVHKKKVYRSDDGERSMTVSAAVQASGKFRHFGEWYRAQYHYVEKLFVNNILEKVMKLRNWKWFPRQWWHDVDHLVHYAKRYADSGEWKKMHPYSYRCAARCRLIFAVCKKANIKIRHEEWSWDEIVATVKNNKYPSYRIWREKYPGAHERARQFGRTNELIDIAQAAWGVKVKRQLKKLNP